MSDIDWNAKLEAVAEEIKKQLTVSELEGDNLNTAIAKVLKEGAKSGSYSREPYGEKLLKLVADELIGYTMRGIIRKKIEENNGEYFKEVNPLLETVADRMVKGFAEAVAKGFDVSIYIEPLSKET